MSDVYALDCAIEVLFNEAAENDSPNFRTHTVMYGDDRYSLTLQKIDGKSPSELITELRAENGRLKAGIEDVAELIDESFGVARLHQNGDVAPWDDLLAGGRYEEWLMNFSQALEKGETG